MINISEPYAPAGNPALLSLRNSFRFNVELYRAVTNDYNISLSYPLSSFTGLGISYFSKANDEIHNISSGIFEVINKNQTFLFSLGHDFLFRWGQQIEIDFELNRYSTISLINSEKIPFLNDQKIILFYRIGFYKQLLDQFSIGILSPPIINLEYHTFAESEKPAETNFNFWKEQRTKTKLPLIAVQWNPSPNFALALSNRSKSGENNAQLASEINLKKFTLTAAFRKQLNSKNIRYILGLGSYLKGFQLFSAYDVKENEFRFALSFAPERNRELIELENLEVPNQILYPYRLKQNNPNFLTKITLRNKIKNPVEITIKLSGHRLPFFSKTIILEKGFHSSVGIPVPSDLENLTPGLYYYDVNILAYYRGKQTLTRTLSFEMKDKHDWTGDPEDLIYFLMPEEKRITTESRRIISLYSKKKNIKDALKIAEHFYNFIRYSINYDHDPKPLHQNHDRVQYPTETLNYRSGDCEDLSILMISLLRSVGIEASFVEINNPESEDGHIFIIFDSQKNISQIVGNDENLQNFIIRTINNQKSKLYVPLELTKCEYSFEEAWQCAAKMYHDVAVKKRGLHTGCVKIVDAF
ncbi:MAG: transglutaminase-like domain-containing protein [Calditrichales bacterium]|nr:transglutaminase-like domain-containing protein [Calditrichales bacterium]